MYYTTDTRPRAPKINFMVVMLLALLLSACGTGRYISKGDKRFGQEQYQRAIEFYKQALPNADNKGELNYKIAEAYRLSNRISEAEPFYQAAISGNFRKEDAYYYYGLALKANGKYEQSLKELQDYIRVGSNNRLKALAQQEVENYSNLTEILRKNENFEVRPIPGLNTDASEFAPFVLNNELVFSSTRGGKEYMGNGEGFLNLYAAALTDTAVGAIRPFEGVNQEEIHEAFATFIDEGRTMVFARGNEGSRKGRQNVDLFWSTFRSGAWTEAKLLNINSPQAWDSSPAFSPDGKTLYFSSNRRGGQGGHDIYKSTLENGRFSTPVNLGPEINTKGNESFVSVGPDGTVYIASDGHPGLGNLDLFRIEDGKPINLGKPVNSPGDDFGIYFQDEYTGYFSSNREGGQGGDDIYAFSRSKRKTVNFFVDGTLYQRREGAKQTTVSNNVVVLQNEQGQKVDETTTDANGNFTFPLDSASTYSLVSEKQGFFTARQRVTTVGKMPSQDQLPEQENEVRLTAELVLNQIVKERAIVLENIFYDYDKADIRPDAAEELDKLVQILVDNPRISIELSSHTDARGSDAYNQDLSQRRAESAVEYIISKGIDRSRITARGYGESRPVVRNAQTEAQHQRNRRTEFKVVRVD
ncbi:OmpA family protein [Pontibacter harenae]|uniref:OmpA family protein n=1 Tax=Pontibacter harenae TaxID=2894083 RepID=UPI001E404940|nr:OmpA family protein [Pontibacter harenae]MCC9165296.1 OmpA family protein [Pontibacter harenae]